MLEERFLPTTALVIACGDSDHGKDGFFPEIQEFLLEKHDLRMGQYFPLLRDGGPICLAYQEELAVDFLSMKSSMLRIRRLKPEIKTAILFVHGPCGYHGDALPSKKDKLPEKNIGPRILETAEDILRGMKILGYFKPNTKQKTDFMPIP